MIKVLVLTNYLDQYSYSTLSFKLLLSLCTGIAVISMNRPEARNALGKQFLREVILHINYAKKSVTPHILKKYSG